MPCPRAGQYATRPVNMTIAATNAAIASIMFGGLKNWSRDAIRYNRCPKTLFLSHSPIHNRQFSVLISVS